MCKFSSRIKLPTLDIRFSFSPNLTFNKMTRMSGQGDCHNFTIALCKCLRVSFRYRFKSINWQSSQLYRNNMLSSQIWINIFLSKFYSYSLLTFQIKTPGEIGDFLLLKLWIWWMFRILMIVSSYMFRKK